MSSTLFPDYVIIGAGLCGLVLGAKLTEDPTVSVCILEAGGGVFHDESIDTPAYIVRNLGDPNKDWTFFSTPQKHIDDRAVFLPRGKGIGGSTLLNFMNISRASSAEYDALESLGSPDWNWAEFRKYFKKSETFSYDAKDAATYGMHFDASVHGTSGPLKKAFPRYPDQLVSPWIESAKAAGIPHNPDPSAGDNVGVSITNHSIDTNSVRSSAATAYYEPHQSRPNLKIVTGARATRIVTEGSSNGVLARAVEYVQEGVLKTLDARKEVIVCAGAYQTPQIMELSGIGHASVLEKAGIPVILDLKSVGNNMQEHVTCTFMAKLTDGHETFDSMEDARVAEQHSELYATKRTGMLSSVPSALAFLPFKYIDLDGAIFKAVQESTSKDSAPATKKTYELQKEWVLNDKIPFMELTMFDRVLPGLTEAIEKDKTYISMSIILTHPFSRGSVHVSSSNALDNPVIDVNFLDSNIDMAILVEGYRVCRKIMSTEPLKLHVVEEILPGPNCQSDEDIKSFIRKTVGSTYHPIGTMGMLPEEDGGCVGADLKVYGTANIRVVDASILPIHLSSHLQATLYALAEKAADIIKQ